MRLFQTASLLETFLCAPWFSENEFKDVVMLVTSNKHDDWKKCQERLLVWKVRQGRRFQDIFDLTLSILTDLINLNRCQDVDQQSKLHSASLTIVRFVGLMTEGSLKDKIEKASVLELSANIGIPEWIVDLRHATVHSVLPSSPLVIKALYFAKDYVCDRFWLVEGNSISRQSPDVLRADIRAELRSMTTSAIADQSKQSSNILSYRSYPQFSTVIEEIVKYLLEVLQDYEIPDIGQYRIPAHLTDMVTPVFDLVRKSGFLDHLVREFLYHMKVRSGPALVRISAVWVLYAISGFYSKNADRERMSQDILDVFLRESGMSSGVDRLLGLLNINQREIVQLTQIYSNRRETPTHEVGTSLPDQPSIYTVSDLQAVICDGGARGVTETEEVEDCKWKLAADVDWGKLPLGMTFPPYTYSGGSYSGQDSLLVSGSPVNHPPEEMDTDDGVRDSSSSSSELWSQANMDRLKADLVLI